MKTWIRDAVSILSVASRRLPCKAGLMLPVLLAATVANGADASNPLPYPQPLGVFAKVDVVDALKPPNYSCPSRVDVHTCLQGLYRKLLRNNAVAGLTIGIHWNRLSLTTHWVSPFGVDVWVQKGYDWSWLDDALIAAQGRPVQLVITPGFDSPDWVLRNLTPCDTLFTSGYAPADCGTLQFKKYPEKSHTDGNVLPLPWPKTEGRAPPPAYLAEWERFLFALRDHVRQSPYASSLVAIAMAGPTSGSAEIIMPSSRDSELLLAKTVLVDDAWNRVISNAAAVLPVPLKENTDQPFIDAWVETIQSYQSAFPGVALIILPDGGNELPEYNLNKAATHSDDATLFEKICANYVPAGSGAVSCEAKAEILAKLARAYDGRNLFALQIGGLRASSPLQDGNIGVPAARCFGTPHCFGTLGLGGARFHGGASFDFAATKSDPSLQQELGCPVHPKNCTFNLSPELIAFNLLAALFNDTMAEKDEVVDFIKPLHAQIADADPTSTRRYSTGLSVVQYINVPFSDILYASDPGNRCPAQQDPYIGWMSMQDLLNLAQYELHKLANLTNVIPVRPQPTCI